MTYAETLDYLMQHLPMFQRVGAAAFKKDLTNINTLCRHLASPQAKYPSIHIAGTNGKGSVSHMLAAVLQSMGLKVGLYTSPHYKDFRERVRINGTPIAEDYVVDFVARHRELFGKIEPSFFEITVAMAFDYFAQQKIDIAVIETGMGGRLDSTNIITPILSVITNIGYDHMQFLGDTLGAIAGEKAGIIKPGIPVVVGQRHPETDPVFDKAARDAAAPIHYARDRFTALQTVSALTHSIYNIYKNKKLHYKDLESDLAGRYQSHNLATVLMAVELLRQKGYDPSDAQLLDALGQVKDLTGMMGRFQIIGQRPTVLVDSAHNEDGLRAAFEHILAHDRRGALRIVTGMVNDKDLGRALPHFPREATYYFARPDIPRGLDAEALREAAAAHGLHGQSYASVAEALRNARSQADEEDLVVVTGSIFVVGEIL